jgi:hypothetical protein
VQLPALASRSVPGPRKRFDFFNQDHVPLSISDHNHILLATTKTSTLNCGAGLFGRLLDPGQSKLVRDLHKKT